MRFGWSARQTSARISWMMVTGVMLLIAVYSYIYFKQPFSLFNNSLIANMLSSAASLFSAVWATLVFGKYEKTDLPRRIWGNFVFGLWLWFIGEVAWGYLNLTLPNGEVPTGIQDLFWVTAYYFLGRALLWQYQILQNPSKQDLVRRLLSVTLFMLTAFFLIFFTLRSLPDSTSLLDTIANSYYPAADLTLAVAAIWLTVRFQGGALGRPWIGLLVFTVADLMNAWLQLSGTYAWSLEQGNLLSGISDIIYFSAYLALAFGAFLQWLFLKYGLRSSAETR